MEDCPAVSALPGAYKRPRDVADPAGLLVFKITPYLASSSLARAPRGALL